MRKTGFHTGVLDFRGIFYQLRFRIGDAEIVFKQAPEARDGDINKFVDAGAKNDAAMFLEIGWVVSASAEKADSKGCACNNHFRGFRFSKNNPLFRLSLAPQQG